jgi:hypothetical protein
MDAGDCLVCAAAREAGRAECKACGQVFTPEPPLDQDDPAYYFGAPPAASKVLAPPVNATRRRFRIFGR